MVKGETRLPLEAGNALASSGLDEAAWVFVYEAKSAHMVQVLCTDTDVKAPDTACAIAGAKRAFHNIT